jgi:hypothetical protein
MGWYHDQIANGEDPFADVRCSLPPKNLSLDTSSLNHIYHLCQRAVFVQAVEEGKPYFPPTFVKDGRFTRASQEKDSLADTANSYYKDIPGEWICLELNAQKILQLGIQILPQCAPEGTAENPINCWQIFGGITTAVPGLVISIHKMIRLSDGLFYAVDSKPCTDIPLHHVRKEEARAPSREVEARQLEPVNDKRGRTRCNPFRRK